MNLELRCYIMTHDSARAYYEITHQPGCAPEFRLTHDRSRATPLNQAKLLVYSKLQPEASAQLNYINDPSLIPHLAQLHREYLADALPHILNAIFRSPITRLAMANAFSAKSAMDQQSASIILYQILLGYITTFEPMEGGSEDHLEDMMDDEVFKGLTTA